MPHYEFRGHLGLAENETFSAEKISEIIEFKNDLASLPSERDSLLEKSDSDSAFIKPAALWEQSRGNAFSLFQYLVSADWSIIKHLRLYACIFSGFHLFDFELARVGMSMPKAIPDGFDSDWRMRNPSPDGFARHWQELAKRLDHRDVLIAPLAFGEIGFDYDGLIVNGDVCFYQERLFILAKSGVLDWLDNRAATRGRALILDIGGGYGALAHAFTTRDPNLTYVICDLPESLMCSGLYLKGTVPDGSVEIIHDIAGLAALRDPDQRVYLLSNHLAPALADSGIPIDFAINTLSMAEMGAHQVQTYGGIVSRLIGSDGLFFEQNYESAHLTPCKTILREHFSEGITLESPSKLRGTPSIWANDWSDWEPPAP